MNYLLAAKTAYAGIVVFLGSVSAILIGDVAGFGDISQGQWVTIALGVVVAIGGVFGLQVVETKVNGNNSN